MTSLKLLRLLLISQFFKTHLNTDNGFAKKKTCMISTLEDFGMQPLITVTCVVEYPTDGPKITGIFYKESTNYKKKFHLVKE